MRAKLCLFVFVVLLAGSPAFAQYIEIYRIDQVAKSVPEEQALQALAAELQLPHDILKQQKADNRLTVGELFIANSLAKAMKADFKAILGEYKAGKTWGVIAKEKKVDMGQIAKGSKDLEEALKKSQRQGS